MKKLLLSSLLALTVNINPTQADTLEERILEGAKTSQTVMFGERHDTPIEERYVAYLLPALKRLGYTYLAMEGDTNDDMHNFFSRIVFNGPFDTDFSYLITKAEFEGMNVVFVDDRSEFKSVLDIYNKDKVSRREKKIFANLRRMIFDSEPNAKVIIFYGANHIQESLSGLIFKPDVYKIEWLGSYMEKFTSGKNLSVCLIPYHIHSADINASEKPEWLSEILNIGMKRK